MKNQHWITTIVVYQLLNIIIGAGIKAQDIPASIGYMALVSTTIETGQQDIYLVNYDGKYMHHIELDTPALFIEPIRWPKVKYCCAFTVIDKNFHRMLMLAKPNPIYTIVDTISTHTSTIYLEWASDSLILAYRSDNGHLMLYDVIKRKSIYESTDSVNSCAWSPSGLNLLLKNETGELSLLDVKNSFARTELWPSNISMFEWFPDGNAISFVVGTGNKFSIYRNNLDSKPAKLLGTIPEKPSMIKISPDGKWIIAMAQQSGDAFLLSVAGGKVKRITKPQEGITEAVWSPDGTQLAYIGMSKKLLWGELYLLDIKTFKAKKVSDSTAANIRWASKQNILLYTTQPDSLSEIEMPQLLSLYVFNPKDKKPKIVTRFYHPTTNEFFPCWCPDDETILFSRDDYPHGTVLYYISKDGGQDKRITFPVGFMNRAVAALQLNPYYKKPNADSK